MYRCQLFGADASPGAEPDGFRARGDLVANAFLRASRSPVGAPLLRARGDLAANASRAAPFTSFLRRVAA
jgi:hypothetical protein